MDQCAVTHSQILKNTEKTPISDEYCVTPKRRHRGPTRSRLPQIETQVNQIERVREKLTDLISDSQREAAKESRGRSRGRREVAGLRRAFRRRCGTAAMPTGIIGAQRHWALHFVREAMLKSRRDMRELTRCDATESRCTERL